MTVTKNESEDEHGDYLACCLTQEVFIKWYLFYSYVQS